MGGSNEGSFATMKMFEDGPNQPKIAKKEIMEKGEEDRISALPDCLLLEILSRLPSTKNAIRTGTLSKRWERLWTLVSSLIFSYTDYSRGRCRQNPNFMSDFTLSVDKTLTQCRQNPNFMSDFTLSVDKTLTQCRQSKLKKFEVHTLYDIRFESHFNYWIRHAISCSVEELNLQFLHEGSEAEFRLDQFLCINSCFTDLRLVGCKLNPSGAISWKNLTSLCISYMNLDEDLIRNILSGSPLLETLMLEDWCYSGQDITLYDESEDDIIEINASNNLSLTQCPQLKLKKFIVFTDFDIQFESQLNSWIRYAIRCNVQKISLTFWSTYFDSKFLLDQTLFTSSCFTKLKFVGCMFNPVGAISWKNLRSLSISNSSLNDDLIENILSGSPVLETLELIDCYGYRRLHITSKSVKNLVLNGYRDPHGKSEAIILEINAPNISSLIIQDDLELHKLLLLNVSSLVKANLDYTCTKITHPEVEEEMLKGFLMNLCHVKELKIGISFSKVLSCLQAKGFIFPPNVKVSLSYRD